MCLCEGGFGPHAAGSATQAYQALQAQAQPPEISTQPDLQVRGVLRVGVGHRVDTGGPEAGFSPFNITVR